MSPLIGTKAAMSAQGYGFAKFVAGGTPIIGAFDALATVTLASAQSSITFSGIPNTYTHLQIRASVIAGSNDSSVTMRMNGDSGSNYTNHRLFGNGSASAVSDGLQAQSRIGYSWDMASNPNAPFVAIIDILDYANVNKNKVYRSLNGVDANSYGIVTFSSGAYLSTNALTSLTFYVGTGNPPTTGSNFNQYTTFALYGVK